MLVGIAILILQLAVPNHYKTLYNQELLFNGTTISSFKKNIIITDACMPAHLLQDLDCFSLVKSLSEYALGKMLIKLLL